MPAYPRTICPYCKTALGDQFLTAIRVGESLRYAHHNCWKQTIKKDPQPQGGRAGPAANGRVIRGTKSL